MAYNYYPGFQYPYTQPYQVQPVQGQSMQIQNGGFVSVRSMEEAYNYPIAPGNSITFKDENSPYVYTKTKGFSPLEQPIFEKYRLVKEEDGAQMAQNTPKTPQDAFNAQEQIKALWDEIEALKRQINVATDKPRKTAKKEVEQDGKPDE